jgi:hypothetical protein
MKLLDPLPKSSFTYENYRNKRTLKVYYLSPSMGKEEDVLLESVSMFSLDI